MFQGRVPERSEHLGADRVPDTWGRVVFRNTTTEVFRRAVGPRVSTFLVTKQTRNNGARECSRAVFRNVPNTWGQNVCRERSERYRSGVPGSLG